MTGGSYVKLAESAAEHYVRHQQFLPLPPTLPPNLQQQRACYVSIFENPGHRLRAMSGYPLPQQPTLAHEIITNTIKAVTDSHHVAIRRVDLSYLRYAVAVLGPLERVGGPEHLNPSRHGLYLRSDRGASSIVLPQRAGVETASDQIATAMRESGVDQRREAVTLYRFHVSYFE